MAVKPKASECKIYCHRLCQYINHKDEQCGLYYDKIDNDNSALQQSPPDYDNDLDYDYPYYTLPQCRFDITSEKNNEQA